MQLSYDIETAPTTMYDPNDTSMQPRVIVVNSEPDPYAGLNRKQRRHAIASETRAQRKAKRRG